MTRLSIQSRNEIPNVSIHLRPGQSCTIGSGAAADYCLNDRNIAAIYCRLRCHSSGGYIECLDPEASIVVNQRSKNRSRLINGDSLTIGSVKLDVEMPQIGISNAEFHVNFEDEDSPSTLGEFNSEIDIDDEGGASLESIQSIDEKPITVDTESKVDSDSPPVRFENDDSNNLFDDFDDAEIGDSNDSATQPTLDLDDEPRFSFGPSQPTNAFDEPDSDDPLDASPFNDASDDDLADDAPGHTQSRQANDEVNADAADQINDSEIESAEPAPTPKTTSEGSSKQGKTLESPAQFTFDSNDPNDVELSENEMEEIYDDKQIESFPTMSVSIADDIDTDSDSVSVSLDHDVDLTLLDRPFESQSDASSKPSLPAGIHTGKFWRWSGSALQPAIERLLESHNRLNVFLCRGMQTQAQSLSLLRKQLYLQQENSLYLMTSMTIHGLQDSIRVNRWDDRMGHPRALRMFLEYAPNSVLTTFFESVDSVLLVEEGEASLLRLNREL